MGLAGAVLVRRREPARVAPSSAARDLLPIHGMERSVLGIGDLVGGRYLVKRGIGLGGLALVLAGVAIAVVSCGRSETGKSAAATASVSAPAVPSASDAVTGEMVKIPAGSFQMGAIDGNFDEKPIHEVKVEAFELDRFEVTVAAYAACVEAGKCLSPVALGTCNWGRMAGRSTRSTVWTGITRRRSASGRGSVCRRRRSGSTRRGERTGGGTRGGTLTPGDVYVGTRPMGPARWGAIRRGIVPSE